MIQALITSFSFALILLFTTSATYAQTGTKVVVVPLGSDVSTQQFNQLAARVAALEANKPFVVEGPARSDVSISSTRTVVNQVNVTAPSAGQVFVVASGTGVENNAGEDIRCALSTTPSPGNSNSGDSIWEASGATTGSSAGEGDAGVLVRNDAFPIAAGQTSTYYLTCRNTVAAGTSQVWGPKIQAIFIPD